ncbi:MAG: TonB-dependent receptor [Pseudomonadota bacterium]
MMVRNPSPIHLVVLVAAGVLALGVPTDVLAGEAAVAPADDSAAGELDDLSLEQLLDVVVTTTRTAENLYESPGIITVVTREELLAWGYSSLAEALRYMVGFYVIDDHAQPNLAVRGVSGGLRAESGVIKVMIDGQSVAFRSTGGSWLGTELVPLSAVERIEVVRGPASAMYGADAFLGVINIITRDGGKVAGGELWLGGNAISTNLGADQDLSVGLRQGPFEALVATRLHSEDRSGLHLPETSPAPNLPAYSVEDRVADGLRRSTATALLKLGYHFGPETRLQLAAYLSAFDAGGEFADWLQLGYGVDDKGRFNENRTSLAQGLVNLQFDTRLFEALDLGVRATYFAGGVTPNDRVDVGSDVFYVRRELGYRGAELDATGAWRFNEGLLVLGNVGLIWDQEQKPSTLRVLKGSAGDSAAGTIYEPTSTRQGEQSLVNPGASTQVIWKPFGKMLGLTAGARYDYHNIYGHHVSGRLAAVSTPARGVHLKAILGNAYKAPSPYQLYAVPFRAGDVIGNPDLRAQQVYSIEAQAAYEHARWLVLSLGAGYQLLWDTSEFTPQGVNQVARNVAEIHAMNVEAELLVRHHSGVHGYVNLGINSTQRLSGEEGYRAERVGTDNVLYPPAIANGGLRYTLPWLPLRAGVEVSAASRRRASATNILAAGRDYYLPATVQLGASVGTAGWHLFAPTKETAITFIARNLLDDRGPDPGFGGVDYPLVGRSFVLQLRQEF